MSILRHFPSYSDARQKFRYVLDAAHSGVITSIERDGETFLIVPAKEQRESLAALRPSNAQVIAEGGGWAVIIPGMPLHGDGETLEEAVHDAIEALREYAEDWNERLHTTPNHRQHRPVVELVEFSTDEEIRQWLLGMNAEPRHEGLMPA
jgi:predicted RNase H-like HicB family nuclease